MRIERVSWAAGTSFATALPEPLPEPVAQLIEVEQSLLVLGSRQRAEIVDTDAAARAAVEVVRRRSGGGAVLLHGGRSLWLDVLLPRSDPLWSDDVGLAFHWLGDVWAGALAGLGVPAEVHRGGLTNTAWGSLVCFGSIGPGEVVIDGRKVVGMSQRRTRAGARFQCLVHDTWQPEELLELLVLDRDERRAAAAELADRAAGPGVPLAELEHAVVARLAQL
jgi:lipoate---protein ligase